MKRENMWTKYSEAEKAELEVLSKNYRDFLDHGKTERECICYAVAMAEKAGYRDLKQVLKAKETLKAGDKIYSVYMGKSIMLFQIGTEDLENGLNILGAHVDSPRLDLKQNPMYEDTEQVLLDTHYYGGIKKYQWVAMPLALHGVIAKKDGTVVTMNIGEQDEDPVFYISDLLPHLGADQMSKKASEVISGENLDVLIGNAPLEGAEKEACKANILQILKEMYDIEEEDFLSAEIEVVPAGRSRDVGFDRSMIMGYGHDDRICAYASLAAQLQIEAPATTAVCLLVDKEEIGSMGASGMQSRFFENTVAEIMNALGQYSGIAVRRALSHSSMLSSDVSAAFDPNFASVSEKKNTAYLGHGLVFNKYTGARGKSGSNDASAEYVGRIRKIMDDAEVAWQTAELGRVDQGGGGTIAYISANYGMEVIDSGMAILSMHAPWEVASKVDIYEGYKGYLAFLKNA